MPDPLIDVADLRDGTYPPDDHFLRDLSIVSERVSRVRTVSATELDPGKLDNTGQPAIGFLAALIDLNAAQAALLAVHPKWTATSGLSVHLSGAGATRSVLSESTVVRVGSNLVVVRTSVYDGNGDDADALLDDAVRREPGSHERARIASALLTFVRIPGEASRVSATFDPAAVSHRNRMGAPAEPRAGAIMDRIGGSVLAPGMVSVEPSEYVNNSFATINGGVYGVLFAAAIESLSPGLVTTDIEVQFLSQTKVGPVVTTALPVRDVGGVIVCELEARVADKVLATGTATASASR